MIHYIYYFLDTFKTWNPLKVIVVYLILAIAGIYLSFNSDDAIDSFIGYNMAVIPAGVVLSITLDTLNFDQLHVMNIIYATSGVTILMILSTTLFPTLFEGLEGILLQSLISSLIVEGSMYFSGVTDLTKLDLFVAAVFCIYIGYDWAKVQSEDPTPNNAVDACVSLYLDILNFGLRIASASSSRSSGRRRR